MSFIDLLKKLFGRGKPKLPSAPKPSNTADRLYLRTDRLVWKTMEDVKKALGNGVGVSGKTVDLRGAVIDGSKLKRAGNSQDENAPGITVAFPHFTLVNGWVTDVPGGIVVKDHHGTFEKLKFINIGEDALSTVGDDASDIRISNCEFWNDHDGDKSIQLNQALGAAVRNCLIVGGITGMRVQKDSYGTVGVACMVHNVTFEGCETGLNVAGKATVRLSGSTFTNVKKPWVTGSGARVLKV